MKASRVWRVTIAAHAVEPRWHVSARIVELVAADAEDAITTALRWAHSAAGVPPWKPCVRASWEYASAERAEAPSASRVAAACAGER